MKKINPKKVLLGAILALVTTSAVGCVVAERPYASGPYRRYEYVRPYYPFYPYRYYSHRDHYRWHRDHDRRDRE